LTGAAEAVLRVVNVTKSFGRTKVLDGVTLEVPEGSIYGFIGANGAGKTTTMKIALGMIRPDGGEVFVCGEKVRCGMTPTNRNVGYLPDVPEFYGYMRPAEYLRMCGKITGLPDETIKKRTSELLEMVGLRKANKRIAAYSRGMKQRLGVAQALINEPKLLICDEPTSALDPLGRREVLEILRKIKGKTTVIFSTHILSDVEKICDRAAMLADGKIALEGSLAELAERNKKKGLRIEFSTPSEAAAFNQRIPPEWRSEKETSETERVLVAPDALAAERVAMEAMLELNLLPVRMERLETNVEDLCLGANGGA
jgi:ABC-2 type transport system ATP-binding protein